MADDVPVFSNEAGEQPEGLQVEGEVPVSNGNVARLETEGMGEGYSFGAGPPFNASRRNRSGASC